MRIPWQAYRAWLQVQIIITKARVEIKLMRYWREKLWCVGWNHWPVQRELREGNRI